MALIDVQVPDMGDFKDVAIIEVLVKPGDTVKAEQSLVTVESDKASMEIPSSHAGVIKDLKVKVGDKVAKGTPIAVLEGVGGAAVAPAAAIFSLAELLNFAASMVRDLLSSPSPRTCQEGGEGGVCLRVVQLV